ncbi:MAG: PAS domain S-box protein [Ignavibacteriales bacterium]|nr:PAS domain S-box protein [Ignavibacteriales bacterium]
MSTLKLYCCIVVLTFFFYHYLIAQQDSFSNSWRWAHFTTEYGLPSDNVIDVIETPDNTLWAICDAGIAWYDSFQWHPVSLPGQLLLESKSTPCDYRKDSILVGLTTGEWYAVGKNGMSKLPVPTHSKVTYVAGDTILFVENGLPSFVRRTDPRHLLNIRRGSDKNIHEIQRTKGNRVWITTSEGTFRWENNDWRLMFRFGGLPSALSFHLDENPAGAVFASCELPLTMSGMWRYIPGSKVPHRIPGSVMDLRAIAISPTQMLIAAYYSGDVRIRIGRSWDSSPILQEKCKGLHKMFFRKNGGLIITTSNGIHYYQPSSSRWHFFPGSEPERGAVNEILLTRTGDTWIGTANGIVVRNKNGEIKNITRIYNTPLIAVTGLAEDMNGCIWVSSGGSFDGAYRWDGSIWKYFTISENKHGARFHKIRTDRRGRLWFLGLSKFVEDPAVSEPGTFIYDGVSSSRWNHDSVFSNRKVYAFDEDMQGGLWFGSSGGISRWRNGQWRHWAKAQGLQHSRVFTLAVDRSNNVWFGHQTLGYGLGCIDSSGAVKYFTTSDGLVNDYVWEVRVDARGVLWIATRGGLGSYDNGIWSRFDESSGLPSNLLWPILPLEDEVYVGTHGKGVVVLNRKESFIPGPRIVIEKPNIDKQDVHLDWKVYSYWGVGSPGEILTQYRIDHGPWSEWSKLRNFDLRNVEPGEHTLEVQARGVFRTSPKDVQSAMFTVLPPLYLRPAVLIPASVLLTGLAVLSFILIIRKRHYNTEIRHREAKFRAVTQMTHSAIIIFNKDLSIIYSNKSTERLTGYSHEELQSMKITDILVPDQHSVFFSMERDLSANKDVPQRAEFEIIKKDGVKLWIDLTWGDVMFQGIPAIIGTAFDITERKFGELRIRALASELSATEQRSRKRMAAFLHDKIGHALALSKMKVESLIEGSENTLMRQSAEEAHALLRDAIQTTRSFTFELSPPILYDLGLVPAIDWLLEELQKREKIQTSLSKPVAKILIADEVRNVLFEGTREVLINAIKHSRANNIDVGINATNSMVTVSVGDNGVGFDVSGLDQTQTVQKSFGLFNLRERLHDIGGRLEIDSQHKLGTTIRMIAPVLQLPNEKETL